MNRVVTVLLAVAPLFVMCACGRLDSIPMSPSVSPQEWLATHPYVTLGSLILTKPSSSFIVFVLGFITLFIGIYLYVKRGTHQSRKWWGIALILWGIGTFFAGTSYQLFYYEIKCAHQVVCSFTSWYEVAYMIFEVASVNALLIAVGYSSGSNHALTNIKVYTSINMIAYVLVSLTGGFLPNQFLVSFELMMLFCIPNFIICFIFNVRAYKKDSAVMDKRMYMTWIYLLIVMAAYYGYLLSGYGNALWAKGIWFSANDVLHIGLILWMLYILLGVSGTIKDRI